jgi:hypothetical protein
MAGFVRSLSGFSALTQFSASHGGPWSENRGYVPTEVKDLTEDQLQWVHGPGTMVMALADEQKAKWRELTGDPFQLETACPPPPGSFGPREVLP